ncbi:MAG: flagellar type III secretion system pore protein FliP [Minwuia sp.]|nr:flagellar type III secretion system pore protein FliP [Minwuia sp.]
MSARFPHRLAVMLPALLILSLPAMAQDVSIDLGEGGSFTGRVLQLVLMLTVLSLAPAILVVVTSFTRIVIVLSLLRSAMGVQTTPPNVVIISLALFLTAFIMAPTFEASWEAGIKPLLNEEVDEREGLMNAINPIRQFMLAHVREKDLALFIDIGQIDATNLTPEETPIQALIPAFMISELKRAFEIGFLLFIPFLVIDMVVASVLMSMGMMMLPPIIISLPFKLIFFVIVDGWNLVAESLVRSFVGGGGG